MTFRTKPLMIEALKYQADLGNNRVINWLALHGASLKGWLFHDGEITVPRPEGGFVKAFDGDWIIRGVKGEFYPCKPDIFDATYEEAGSSAGPVGQPYPAAALYARIQDLEAVINQASSLLHRCWTSEGIDVLDKAIADMTSAPPPPVGQHYHKAKYENGGRVDECAECGELPTHPAHKRVLGPPDPPRPKGDHPVG